MPEDPDLASTNRLSGLANIAVVSVVDLASLRTACGLWAQARRDLRVTGRLALPSHGFGG